MTRADVLIVEDDSKWQSELALYVTDAGFTSHVASDLAEALDLLERQRFDAALVDLALAGPYKTNRDGERLVRAIHLMGEGTSVVVVSGTATVELASKISLAFDTPTIRKTRGVEHLEEVVGAMVRRGRTGRPSATPVTMSAIFRGAYDGAEWTHRLLGDLGPGSGNISQVLGALARLTRRAWPLVPQTAPIPFLDGGDAGSVVGLYWSRRLATAVVIGLGRGEQAPIPSDAQAVTLRGEIVRLGSEVTTQVWHRIAGVVREAPDVDRGRFSPVVNVPAEDEDDDWVLRLLDEA